MDKKKKHSGNKFVFFLIFVGAMSAVLLKFTTVFLIGALMPCVVAFLVDTSYGRYSFKTVTAMNIAGASPFALELMMQGNTSSAVQAMIGDMYIWLMIYAAAGTGWLIVWAAPHLAYYLIVFISAQHAHQLERAQEKLIEEWGPEVSGD